MCRGECSAASRVECSSSVIRRDQPDHRKDRVTKMTVAVHRADLVGSAVSGCLAIARRAGSMGLVKLANATESNLSDEAQTAARPTTMSRRYRLFMTDIHCPRQRGRFAASRDTAGESAKSPPGFFHTLGMSLHSRPLSPRESPNALLPCEDHVG